MSMIKLDNITKKFGKFTALDNVSLEIPKGRIVGLLGKNGAGKSTLMKCMLGYLKFAGDITFFDMAIPKHKKEVMKRVAFIPDVNILDERLTVQQTIDYVAGLNPNWCEKTALRLLERSNLPLDKKVKKLSKGMKTKLYLLVTLSLDVDILILDEPTLGLDISFRKEFFNIILGEFYDENKTIIISTHQVEEVEHILQDIIFIDEGKIVLHESVEDLKDSYKIISVTNDKKDELMKYNPLQISYSLGHVSGLLEADVEIDEADYIRPDLSEIFLAKVGGTNE